MERNSNDFTFNRGTLEIVPNTPRIKLFVGYAQSCALLNNSELKCWGNNLRGQLGQGHTNNLNGKMVAIDLGSHMVVRSITGGAIHMCALLGHNQVKCWGSNEFGQLGQGHTNHLGDGLDENGKSEMGDNLALVDLDSGLTVKSVVAGWNHTCALLSHNQVKCWGSNEFGQLGQGHTNHLGDGLDENGKSEMGGNLPVVNLGRGLTAQSVVVGGHHTCVLLSNNQVKCWGANGTGGLGQGHRNHLGDGLDENGKSEMGDNLPVVDLGRGLTAQSVVVGGYHTCVLLSNYQVKCWGHNSYGQLGQNHWNPLGDAANQMGDNLACG